MSSDNLAKQYQRKTDKQHILDNPDTYIGSVENVDSDMWIYDNEKNQMTHKTIEYIPGLYKLFDEGIVNCRDHVIRMIHNNSINKQFVSQISVNITEDGTIELYNDGNGIDIAKHPEYDIWIPEMIFGHLRTSTNYDKNEKRIVGGKNGFGFKLVLIWSTYGRVETVDHTRGLKYIQEFKNNLNEIGTPKITKCTTSKPYTKVTFKPDYTRFGIQGINTDMMNLLKKRVYDISSITDHSIKKIKVSFNNSIIPIKTFQQYIDLYIGSKGEHKRIYENPEERWEYAVAMSPNDEFMQVSFVNGISTSKGGKHIDYIMGQITRKLCDYIEKKKKVKVNATAIKEQLILFLRCDIDNPSFDSQTKDYMNTPLNKFGSTCNVTDAFIEKIAKLGVMDRACNISEAKDQKLAKKTDGAKTKNVRGISNFIDANYSGGTNSKDCILILCEGLSAMSGIVSGLSADDRNTIGIYPLKGKLLNVRGEQLKRISENKEINDIKKIMGLESGKVYESLNDVQTSLRYGKIMILCDQDSDGSHIKGLCINMFHSEWASLIRIPGFLSFMNTPILRAKKGSQVLNFYNDGEYEEWKQSLNNDTRGWNIKYFKGLGTSTSTEFKEYFANKKIVDFVYTGPESDNIIDKVFNKKRANDRKEWLVNYDKDVYLNTSQPRVNYEDFVNKELIHFSTYDCARSIPNVIDGLKTSLRKILYSAFKRNLNNEIKVAQFSGYVSEHSAYHHGEASLNGAIVNMAQTFVGSNNINLLMPNGQFGTRLQGGDDSASERYIFTQLNPLTRYLYPETDDQILQYQNDDGTIVEPEFYVPIIPMALINGISGIGTGFSCSIPPYNVENIVNYLKKMLQQESLKEFKFIPYYEGFKGTVREIDTNKFLIKGVYEKVDDNNIIIKELPVGTWTMPYITFLESVIDNKKQHEIRDFHNLSTEVNVHIQITFHKGVLEKLETELDINGTNGLTKLLKLTTSVSTTNMHLFDDNCKLQKYKDVQEIIEAHAISRLHNYNLRKKFLIEILEKKLVKMNNRARYIQAILDDELDLRKKKSQEVHDILVNSGYNKVDDSFKYLIKMPMDSVTDENVKQIMEERDETTDELEFIKKMSIQKMWYSELELFEAEFKKFKAYREKLQSPDSSGKQPKMKKRVVRKKATSK